MPFTAFPGLKIDAQQCFNEVGSFGASQVVAAVSASETTTADYATRTWADSTDTAVSDIAAISTTVDVASESVTDAASATETAAASTTTEAAAAEVTPPMPMRLRVRQEAANASTTDVAAVTTTDAAATTTTDAAAAVSTTTTSDVAVASAIETSVATVGSGASCSVLSAGTMLNLVPDFKSSRKDFSRVRQIFVTFVEGLNVISIPVGLNSGIIGGGGFGVPVPRGIGGQVFVFITVVDISGRTLSDSDVLFGPGIVESKIPFPSATLRSDANCVA